MRLTVLHDGLGRDSRTIACLLAERRLLLDGELVGPEAIDAAVFSDTGNEWPHTYALIPRVRAHYAAMGIPFYHLQKPQAEVWRGNERAKGSREEPVWRLAPPPTMEERAASGYYHTRPPLREEFLRHAVIAVTSSASCSDNHKIQPMRRWLSDLSVQHGGHDNRAHGAAVRAGRAQPHRILIGFTADEQGRADGHTQGRSYERLCFPLLDAGISKDDEAEILWRHGWDDDAAPIFKSGCYLCPFQPAGWFWVLSVQHPELFALVVEYEDAALARHPKMLVLASSKLRLPAAVAAWRSRYPHVSPEDVLRKEYSRCPRAHPAQLPLLEDTEPTPPGQYLVHRLNRQLATGQATPESLRALARRLLESGRPATADYARLRAALLCFSPVAGEEEARGEQLALLEGL